MFAFNVRFITLKTRRSKILLLFLVFAFLVAKNFPYNSWFTGWDNLHPEFNFSLNIKRAIFAVWQENQGLGTYGGHGYAASLPHTLFLFFLSFLLPTKYLRSTFTFLTLIAGTLGVYYLIKKVLEKKGKDLKNKAAFLGALFYLLNFGTIQNFYIPLEAFIVHFAFLPWLFYSLLIFLEKKTKRNMFIFSLVTFLSSTQGFIPPLFLVYFLFLLIFLLFYILEEKNYKRIKESALIILLTLAINAYWLLPVAYYGLTRTDIYLSAYNNLASTEDFILANKKYGNLNDVILLRGFISETIDASAGGEIFPIFDLWIKHFEKKQVLYLGYLYFGIILIGALNFLFKKSKRFYLAFLLALIISFSCLASDVFPFSLISKGFQTIPIFKQAFRAAFTKFSISLSLFYALFFGIGSFVLVNYLEKSSRAKAFKHIFFFLAGLSLIYFSLPAFTGNLFYQRTKVNIPKVYFDLFEFFKKEDKKTRIANFPQGWHWGWSIYRWGYSGSGFLWYGIEQPILDRAFDVWGKENENYHWEIVYALYSENFTLFEKILEKYHINWLVFDKNIIPYQHPRGFLFVDEFEEYLKRSKKVTLEKAFKSTEPNVREIKAYKVNLTNKPEKFILSLDLDKAKNIGPRYSWASLDKGFLEEEIYYTSEKNRPAVYYPFRSLFTGRKQEELEFEIEDQGEFISFKKTLPVGLKNYILKIPAINKEEFLEIDSEDPSITRYQFPEIYLEGKPIFSPQNKDELKELEIKIPQLTTGGLEVRVPKIRGYFAYDSNLDKHFLNHEAVDCDLSKEGIFKQEVEGEDLLRFTSLRSANCFDIILSNLSQRRGYLIEIQGKHIKGKSLQFAVSNHESKKADIDISLSKIKELNTVYLINPPMKPFGRGYSLHFNNVSIGKTETVNDLKRVTINPVPFDFLKSLKLVKPTTETKPEKKLLIYSQSFDPGWKLLGVKGAEHVLVNNWANGWLIEKSNSKEQIAKIKIVYLPQFLEYFGFFLVFLFLFWYNFLNERTSNLRSEGSSG